VNIFMVGSGGSGGSGTSVTGGGGGGGGGGECILATSQTFSANTQYKITIGNGITTGQNNTKIDNGTTNTTLFTARGGGAGGNGNSGTGGAGGAAGNGSSQGTGGAGTSSISGNAGNPGITISGVFGSTNYLPGYGGTAQTTFGNIFGSGGGSGIVNNNYTTVNSATSVPTPGNGNGGCYWNYKYTHSYSAGGQMQVDTIYSILIRNPIQGLTNSGRGGGGGAPGVGAAGGSGIVIITF
jgi:hypothetical protein